MRLGSIFGSTGHWFLTKIRRTLGRMAFFWVCLKLMFIFRASGRKLMWRIVIQQIFFTGAKAFELIVAIALMFGALVVVQGLARFGEFGSLDELSVLIIAVLVREIGPMLTAIIVILRSGSAMAMEIGYMNVLGEIEGLEMQGIPTLQFLAVPRLIGVSISVVCLTVIFDLVAVAGGFFTFAALEGVKPWMFFHSLGSSLREADFLAVIVKGTTSGLIIPVICIHDGFLAEKAITNVPPRVSQALVDCLIYCVFFNILITVVFSA